MIHILADSSDEITTELVARAFERCFTRGQIRLVDDAAWTSEPSAIVVALAAGDAIVPDLRRVVEAGGKVILLGRIGPRLAALAGVEPVEIDPDLSAFADCAPAPVHGMSES